MNIDITTIHQELPDFNNHDEAKAWFTNKFPGSFRYKDSDEIDGITVHYYHLIKDSEAYSQYMETLESTESQQITSVAPFESYSTIEITDDGDISISI